MRALSCLLLSAASLFAQAPGRAKRTVTDAEVMRVHRSAILMDTHNDVTSSTVANLDIGKPNTDHETDLPRMKKGGMGAQFFAAYVSASYVEGNHSAHRTLEMIDTVRRDIVEKYPNDSSLLPRPLFAAGSGRIRETGGGSATRRQVGGVPGEV